MFHAKLWNQTLQAYRAQDWDRAEMLLVNLVRTDPHPLYELYASRISHYRQAPPDAEWNGVTSFETK